MLKPCDINTLKPGDKVYYIQPLILGWTNIRNRNKPQLFDVKSITPKRTKITLIDNKREREIVKKEFDLLFEYSDELAAQANTATNIEHIDKMFSNIVDNAMLKTFIVDNNASDDDINRLYALTNQIIELMNRKPTKQVKPEVKLLPVNDIANEIIASTISETDNVVIAEVNTDDNILQASLSVKCQTNDDEKYFDIWLTDEINDNDGSAILYHTKDRSFMALSDIICEIQWGIKQEYEKRSK